MGTAFQATVMVAPLAPTSQVVTNQVAEVEVVTKAQSTTRMIKKHSLPEDR